MAAFYDGSSGGPDFTGPKRGLEDCAVCAQDFDAISNLFLFVESDAKCLDDEPPWCLKTFRTGITADLKWNEGIISFETGLKTTVLSTRRCRSSCALRNLLCWLTSVNLRQLLDLIPVMV